MDKIQHSAIKEGLLELGFYQTVENKFGCYYNQLNPKLCAYFAPNNEIVNSYVLCEGEKRTYFKTIEELKKLMEVVKP